MVCTKPNSELLIAVNGKNGRQGCSKNRPNGGLRIPDLWLSIQFLVLPSVTNF